MLLRKLSCMIKKRILLLLFKISGPPRVLNFNPPLNEEILRSLGARIGLNEVRIHSPIIIGGPALVNGYSNLTIEDNCMLNGNNFLDLTSRITLEKGVSLGPGVTIMTHNNYNHNTFLEERLAHTCGKEPVLIKESAGIKAHALITMGITVGKEAVVAGGAVVNRDVPDRCFVAGIPAKVIKELT